MFRLSVVEVMKKVKEVNVRKGRSDDGECNNSIKKEIKRKASLVLYLWCLIH